MGRLPAARQQTQTVPSLAEMASRAQKPDRPKVPVTVTEIPVTPAEAAKVPQPAPPEVNVRTGRQDGGTE